MKDQYQDILYLPHHQSKKRRQLSMRERAAQFASFAALTGYEESVEETADAFCRAVEEASAGVPAEDF